MIFRYGSKLTIEISPEVVKFIMDWMTAGDYQNESGGILVGEMQDGSHITITDITTPQRKDRRLPFQFLRSGFGHQEHMDGLWEQSNYRKMYLGEWHTHREDFPSPSITDTCGWRRISKKKQNSPWMIFIILGLRGFRIWTIDHGDVKELVQDA